MSDVEKSYTTPRLKKHIALRQVTFSSHPKPELSEAEKDAEAHAVDRAGIQQNINFLPREDDIPGTAGLSAAEDGGASKSSYSSVVDSSEDAQRKIRKPKVFEN